MMEYITNVARYETEDGDKILYPFSPPIFQTHIDDHFRIELLEEGRKLTKEEDDWSPRLAGNLKYGRSYHYKDDYVLKVEPYLKTYVERFFNGLYKNFGPNNDMVEKMMRVQHDRRQLRKGTLRLDTLWINFSQKHDFNPPHSHTGVLSFVIFCKIPEKIFETQTEGNNKHSGEIVFHHNNPISKLDGYDYPVKPYENLMFIFPSKLKHYVPSYWVDEERISVSGNFVVVDK